MPSPGHLIGGAAVRLHYRQDSPISSGNQPKFSIDSAYANPEIAVPARLIVGVGGFEPWPYRQATRGGSAPTATLIAPLLTGAGLHKAV
jgi:hypothetical protein